MPSGNSTVGRAAMDQQFLKAHGICVICGRKDAANGTVRCKPCELNPAPITGEQKMQGCVLNVVGLHRTQLIALSARQ